VAVVALAGALRALPTLGLLTLFVLLAGIGLMPPIWALVILTVPPLLAGTYAGIANVDRNVVDAARAMGMTELQVLFRAEFPNALTVMFGGFRTGVLQVIATVSVVAYINLGGLGRYLFDGLVLSDFPQMLGGSLLIAALAIAVDLILAVFQRLFLSRGATATPNRSQQAPVDLTDPASAEPVVQGGTS
jgi:osmoprotectant transport system permease protein